MQHSGFCSSADRRNKASDLVEIRKDTFDWLGSGSVKSIFQKFEKNLKVET